MQVQHRHVGWVLDNYHRIVKAMNNAVELIFDCHNRTKMCGMACGGTIGPIGGKGEIDFVRLMYDVNIE